MNRMKVSIVIPVYNVEKYLRLCLDSVLAQKFINYEVILVDDGSTDSSPAICDEYVKKDGRFNVIHQKNGGVSQARNIGVKHAVGDYVFFLDSDDSIHPLMLMKLSEIAEKYKAALIQADVENVSADFSDYKKEIESDFTVYQFDAIDAFYNIDRDNKNVAQDIRLITSVVWAKLYRRDLVEKITFPVEMKLHEDQMLAHRFVFEGGGVVFCRAPLYFYRSRPGSLIKEGWSVKRLVIFDCYNDRIEWAKKIQGDEKRVKDLVYYIYIRYLVCMFKNYWMITRNLSGAEKKQYKIQVMERFRKELKNRDFPLKLKDRMMFYCFGIVPDFFTGCYQLAQNFKSLIKR